MSEPENQKPAWWHWHRHLYNWVVHWADTRFGMVALIVLAITEPICVPIPADVMVIGMCLGKPGRAIRYGLICSIFSVLGGTIAFALGLAIGGDNVVAFFEHIRLGAKVNLALELYRKYDFWAIAISALTPVPYMLFSWLGGMADVSIKKFVLISIIFRTIRFGSEGLLFYLFGRRARTFIEKYFNLATVIVIIGMALIVLAVKKLGHLFTG
ncbi:MAG: DedA family protein [Planctomycetes bacterium]|nr:DedA family protein [Planctomycetota bacterium]